MTPQNTTEQIFSLTRKDKKMSDYLDYLDEIYEELVEEFGHEIESNCIHE